MMIDSLSDKNETSRLSPNIAAEYLQKIGGKVPDGFSVTENDNATHVTSDT